MPREFAPNDDLPSLAGSPVTLVSVTAEGAIVAGRNIPGEISPDRFVAALMMARLSSISGRTLADQVCQTAETGAMAREQCEISVAGMTRTYDIDLWRQSEGGVGILLVDVSGRERSSSRVRALSLELAHRTKNVMAVLLSLANQNARRMPDYERFRVHFFGQVEALSHAHDMIAATGWQGSTIGTVVETCIDTACASISITIAPDIADRPLKPSAVQYIAIALSELQVACEDGGTVFCTVAAGAGGKDGFELCWSYEGDYDRAGLWVDMLCRHAPISFGGYGEIDCHEGGFVYRMVKGDPTRD